MKHTNLMVAIEAALNAGNEILKIYNDPNMDFQVERKADNSPLTIADKKANAKIVELLANTPFPILSEEGKLIDYSIRKAWDTLWIVDPLDGTKEFIKRNGEFTVNIALIHNNKPVLGVIYLPVTQDLYFGEEGLGSYKISNLKNDQDLSDFSVLLESAIKLPIDNQNNDELFRVVASRSHLSPETESYIEELKHKHKNIELVSKGSSIKICLVAEGSANVYPRFAPTMEWDTAAGDAIARAAGMKVCKTDRITPLVYNKEDLLNPWFIVEKAN